MSRFVFFLAFLLSLQALIGQDYHVGRFETTYQWGSDDFVVIPNDNNGVLLIRMERLTPGKQYPVHFTFLDNALKPTWRDSTTIENTFYLNGYDFDGGKNFLLFKDKSNNRDLKIITIDPQNDQIAEFDPSRLTDIEVTYFDVIKNSAVIAGYIEKRPAAFVYDIVNQNLKTLNNVYQNNSNLLGVKINNDSLTFSVLVTIPDEKKDRTVQVNTYDYAGNPVRDYQIITKENHQLTTAVSSSIMNIEQVVTGLYSYKQGTSPSGMYINHIDRKGRQTMRYLPFGAFTSFFEHEGERRARKLKEKSLSGHRKDKPFRYRTEAMFHAMVEEDESLIVMAEFFKPLTISRNAMAMDQFGGRANRLSSFYGNTFVPENLLNAEPTEFEFSHAFVYALDKSGNLMWDHNYEIDETIEGILSSYGAFLYHDEKAYFAHYEDEELVIEFLNREDQQAEPRSLTLPLLNDEDEVRFEEDDFGGVLYWHKNKYLVFGIHHIRPKDKSTPLRKVFFINGIAVSPELVARDLEEDEK